MSILLLHPRTQTVLEQLAIAPPQALLFTGPEGSGKRFTAFTWLRQTVGVSDTQIRVIDPDEKAGVSVAQIRALYHSTRAKQIEPQFFILPDAGSMSAAAQNAFLKLLEEPNPHIHFVLTAYTPDDVLPTIRSRTQHVAVLPLEPAVMQQFLETHHLESATAIQISFVSGGRIGLAAQLVASPELLTLYRSLASDAKTWLASTPFDRLCKVGKLGNDRTAALTFLELAASMAATLLGRAHTNSEQAQWTTRLHAVHTTLESLAANGNVKAQLTHLALTL